MKLHLNGVFNTPNNPLIETKRENIEPIKYNLTWWTMQ
jgi:hypothetical protein